MSHEDEGMDLVNVARGAAREEAALLLLLRLGRLGSSGATGKSSSGGGGALGDDGLLRDNGLGDLLVRRGFRALLAVAGGGGGASASGSSGGSGGGAGVRASARGSGLAGGAGGRGVAGGAGGAGAGAGLARGLVRTAADGVALALLALAGLLAADVVGFVVSAGGLGGDAREGLLTVALRVDTAGGDVSSASAGGTSTSTDGGGSAGTVALALLSTSLAGLAGLALLALGGDVLGLVAADGSASETPGVSTRSGADKIDKRLGGERCS